MLLGCAGLAASDMGPCAAVAVGVFWSGELVTVDTVVVSHVPRLTGLDGLLASGALHAACRDTGRPFGTGSAVAGSIACHRVTCA